MAHTLTLELPEEEMRFVEHFARERGISVPESIDRIIAHVRRTELHPIHPDVLSIAGLIRGVDPEEARMGYIAAKHL